MLITAYFETAIGTEVEAMINVDTSDYWFDLVYLCMNKRTYYAKDMPSSRQAIINRIIDKRVDIVELVRQRKADDIEYYELSFMD